MLDLLKTEPMADLFDKPAQPSNVIPLRAASKPLPALAYMGEAKGGATGPTAPTPYQAAVALFERFPTARKVTIGQVSEVLGTGLVSRTAGMWSARDLTKTEALALPDSIEPPTTDNAA